MLRFKNINIQLGIATSSNPSVRANALESWFHTSVCHQTGHPNQGSSKCRRRDRRAWRSVSAAQQKTKRAADRDHPAGRAAACSASDRPLPRGVRSASRGSTARGGGAGSTSASQRADVSGTWRIGKNMYEEKGVRIEVWVQPRRAKGHTRVDTSAV